MEFCTKIWVTIVWICNTQACKQKDLEIKMPQWWNRLWLPYLIFCILWDSQGSSAGLGLLRQNLWYSQMQWILCLFNKRKYTSSYKSVVQWSRTLWCIQWWCHELMKSIFIVNIGYCADEVRLIEIYFPHHMGGRRGYWNFYQGYEYVKLLGAYK